MTQPPLHHHNLAFDYEQHGKKKSPSALSQLKVLVGSVAKVVKTFGASQHRPKLLTSVATLKSSCDKARVLCQHLSLGLSVFHPPARFRCYSSLFCCVGG
jgi:hypothetical protein